VNAYQGGDGKVVLRGRFHVPALRRRISLEPEGRRGSLAPGFPPSESAASAGSVATCRMCRHMCRACLGGRSPIVCTARTGTEVGCEGHGAHAALLSRLAVARHHASPGSAVPTYRARREGRRRPAEEAPSIRCHRRRRGPRPWPRSSPGSSGRCRRWRAAARS
jgi:hypothetical protein